MKNARWRGVPSCLLLALLFARKARGVEQEVLAQRAPGLAAWKVQLSSGLFSLFVSFRKGELDLGSASAHRASGPAAWEIQLSSRLFSLLPPTHPACENLRDLDSM